MAVVGVALALVSVGCITINNKSRCQECGSEGVYCYARAFFGCEQWQRISVMVKGDRDLLHTFLWGRFTSPGGCRAIVVNARQAVALYPMHRCSAKSVST